MILSASRRSDIPAFYGKWFVKRLNEGFVLVRNPLNAQSVSKIILDPKFIECIVFWTKNATDFMQYLPIIDSLCYKYYFQYTITSYSKDVESGVPEKRLVIDNFIELSRRIGRERVIWRYDPVFLSPKYDIEYHRKWFEYLCRELAPYTEKCIISFLDDYAFLRGGLDALHVQNLTESQMLALAESFSQVAQKYNLKLATCCEKIDLGMFKILHNSCVDGDLVERITQLKISKRKDAGQRPLCGCVESREIGSFNTCRHGCVYCYARRGIDRASVNLYNPDSPMLCDTLSGTEKITEVKPRLVQNAENRLL